MFIAVIALVIAMAGTAMAVKLKPHSVGSRQLQSKAVTTAKLADSSITTDMVAKSTLTGRNFNLAALGTVPAATHADKINDSNAVSGHAAACPAGTTLIRGLCFDSASSGPILGVKAAANACAARGGRLPTAQQLFSARNVINLGDGNGPHSQFTDSYYYDEFEPFTLVVNSSDQKAVLNEDPSKGKEVVAEYEYICIYQLIR
jgi:hypothetical protein